VTLPAMREETHFGRTLRCFVERPPSFYAMLSRSASLAPDSDALICEGKRISYGELADEVDRLAAGFAAQGLRQGERVVMFLSNRPEFVSVLFALQKLGAIAVPVGVREQAPGLVYIITQCGAAGIVYDDALAERVPDAAQAPCLRLRQPAGALSALARGSLGVRMATVDEDDCACILYTSGTTGHPKGAMLTHFNIAHSVIHYEVALKLTHEDKAALAVPASHVTGLVALIAAIVHVGGTLVIVPEFRAADFIALAASERITYSLMVPAMYQLCLLQPGFRAGDLSAWRVGGYGGSPMPVPTVKALAEAVPGLTLVNCYGSTETASPATIMPLGLSAIHHDSVGIAVPCADLRVVDEHGHPLPAGQAGELWIAGPMVVPRYWDNPQATADGFVDGYWKSGDLGTLDEQGFLQIHDRKKDMINRGGYKVFSIEVENCLMAHPQVQEAATVGVPCPVLGERVHAFVYAPGAAGNAAGADALRAQLVAQCRAQLADYKTPDDFTWLAEPLPRNANGKVLKRALRERVVGR